MHNLNFLYDLIGHYGLYAVFLLVMIEGDITLLLAGVLAHSYFFGDYSFARVLLWGTLGGVASDNAAYIVGRGFGKGGRDLRFYRAARPRIERLTDKFGALSFSRNTFTDCAGRHAFFMVSGACLTCDSCCCRWVVVSSGCQY